MKTPRHTKTEEEYQKFKQELGGDQSLLESFNFSHETVLREFTHWIIIENRFPYDRMARTNHMLVSKLPLKSHYDAPQEVKDEFETIMKLLEKEDFYDAHMENFSRIKSVKRYCHIHLIRWHNIKN